MGNGLVHQLVAKNGRLVLIAISYLTPYLAEQLLRGFTLIDPRIAVAIVDIITSLSTWAVVHIENEIKIVGATPANDAIDALKTVFRTCLPHIVLIRKELVVKRQTDGVCSLGSNKIDVGASDIVVLEQSPELGCSLRTHCLLEEQINHPSRVRATKAEHVALGVQPVTEVRSLNKQFFTIRLNKVSTL